MLDKHIPHTHKNVFRTKPLSFPNNVFFDVVNTLIIFQRESEDTIQNI